MISSTLTLSNLVGKLFGNLCWLVVTNSIAQIYLPVKSKTRLETLNIACILGTTN